MSSNIWAQTIFETLEKSADSSKVFYPKLIEKYSNKNFEIKNIKDINKVVFHQAFLNTLIFFNKSNILNLALRDKCSLIDLISTDLLYTPAGELEYVLIQFENQKDKNEIHALKKDQYLDLIGYKQCPSSKVLKAHFSTRNLRNTLSNERLKIPNSKEQCHEFKEEFTNNVKAPYLCDIAHKIKSLKIKKIQLKNTSKSNYRKLQILKKEVEVATSYQKIVNNDSLMYLEKFCDYSSFSNQFCNDMFEVNYWTNAMKKAKDDTAFEYYCKALLNKQTVSKKELQECLQTFGFSPDTCEYLGANKEEIFPKPECKELSISLNHSRIYQSYNDCPAKTGSDSLTTISRVLNHIDSSAPKVNESDCEANLTYSFAKFNSEYTENLFWQVNLCFDDKIQREKVCYPTLLNNVEGSELSLSFNMGRILGRLKGFKNETNSCKIIDEKDYRPSLLEFKTGCYILKNEDQCFGTSCQFRVINDEVEFKNYTFETKLSFDILPFRYTEENQSFIKLIERYKKKKIKEIINISSFKRVFNKEAKAIFTGIGCAEDLLPMFFQTRMINQCTILPFIVDGIIEEEGKYSLVTRTSYDHIHAPRLIPWNYVFSSIKNYQTHHPLNEWSFYAIY